MPGIYIHIPFCKKFCNYCDFYHVTKPDNLEPFLELLKKEAEQRHNYLPVNKISTIYLGGGTPSVCSIEQIEGLLKHLSGIFETDDDCEVTAELNPDDITLPYLKELRASGVNRLSIGIQTWIDRDLRLLNRRHDSRTAALAVENSIKAGFENISLDLIYGIPGMTNAEWESNLKQTLSYDIRHLSAYHLTVEKGTVFGKMLADKRFSEIDEEESVLQFNTLIEKTGEAGFIQYEISNFCREGYFSKHNTNYWKQVPYLGLGPSAHSFNGYSRRWNLNDMKLYREGILEGVKYFENEDLDTRTCFNEYIMTSLRTMWGLDLEYVEKAFGKEYCDYVLNLSSRFLHYGLLNKQEKTLVLTNQGKMISDNIISDLMMPGSL